MEINFEIFDQAVYQTAVEHAAKHNIILPKISELANPGLIPESIRNELKTVSPDSPDPRNLFRIHWYNPVDGTSTSSCPRHIELPSSLTGVNARIVVILGDTFPMIASHKVLAAYGCFVTRMVSGQFDPTRNKAVWPSTGNYCRGGIAISRILGCRGIAVLPEQMSKERFSWLEEWTLNPDDDIIRTFGSESNVKEIYDKCEELESDPDVVILNQFNEFANYLIHRCVTGPSIGALFDKLKKSDGDRLTAFIAGTGSAGTLAAGDYLKQQLGSRIVAVEPIECPTMLTNGYGEHNIQGIGDKHIPLIQNVMNMDFVIGVSDRTSDLMNVLFNSEVGLAFLETRIGGDSINFAELKHIGLSGLANIQAAVKLAKHQSLTSNDVVVCVATDGAAMYGSELQKTIKSAMNGRCSTEGCAEIFGHTLSGCEPAYVMELDSVDRERIFNLGYYTWVEQRGVSLQDFDLRRNQEFWDHIASQATLLDDRISQFNKDAGHSSA